ncbi:MAG TPA: hypothetical protein VNH15_05140 [Elusimicrobiota bacterium]|nr:hypothetical protein [Elusimicrobiota bacterium]
MSKKAAKEAPENEESAKSKSLEELILDYRGEKYAVVPVASAWAKVLRHREENRHLTANQLLEMALKDVLSGEVTWKEVNKATAQTPELLSPAVNGASEKNGTA